MNKPKPMEHVYDWVKLTEWLRAVAPDVARELEEVVAKWVPDNGSLHIVCLDDWARGWCGDGLSATSIAWLRENIATNFWLRVWW